MPLETKNETIKALGKVACLQSLALGGQSVGLPEQLRVTSSVVASQTLCLVLCARESELRRVLKPALPSRRFHREGHLPVLTLHGERTPLPARGHQEKLLKLVTAVEFSRCTTRLLLKS